MSRKGVSYEDLALAFAALGLDETVRGLHGKVQRGSFQCSFFLQLLAASRAEVPTQWTPHLRGKVDWLLASREIYLLEAAAVTSVAVHRLPKHSAECQATVDAVAQSPEVEGGTYPFTYLLHLSLWAPMPGFERYVDRCDVVSTQSCMHLFE